MIILPRAILLDMDGTLTSPLLDFPRIKREMGIGDEPILEALARMSPPKQQAAEAVLLQHEDAAAEASTLNPGCHQLLELMRQAKIPRAIITRNSHRCAQTVIVRHGLDLDVLITREFSPYKPHPAPLLEACRRLNVAPHETWMVGDGQYDVEAGLAAGAQTVWVSHGRTKPFAAEPWRTVESLIELTELLQECLA